MIRVNLLPHATERRAAPEASQTWLLAVMLLVVVEIVALFFFHQTKEDELAEINAEVGKLTSQIADIQNRVKDHEKIKKELGQLRAREDAIAKLQAGRKGPTAVLLEMSRILTPGEGPTVDPDKLEQQRQLNPHSVYNAGWDPKRVWLTDYVEAERNVRLEGVARDGGDVYELAQRLELSQYFDEVTLLPGKTRTDGGASDFVNFALQVKVNY